jgi:hypothetical protein
MRRSPTNPEPVPIDPYGSGIKRRPCGESLAVQAECKLCLEHLDWRAKNAMRRMWVPHDADSADSGIRMRAVSAFAPWNFVMPRLARTPMQVVHRPGCKPHERLRLLSSPGKHRRDTMSTASLRTILSLATPRIVCSWYRITPSAEN